MAGRKKCAVSILNKTKEYLNKYALNKANLDLFHDIRLLGCIEDREYLEECITLMMIHLRTTIGLIKKRSRIIVDISDNDGEPVIYAIGDLEFERGTNALRRLRFRYAKDIKEDESYLNYDYFCAVELLPDKFEQLLCYSFFTAIREYYIDKEGRKSAKDHEIGLMEFGKNGIIFKESKYARYISLKNAIDQYINLQIKSYELIPSLAKKFINGEV